MGGKIRWNTVWTKENSPYILKDDVRIPQGVKLRIEEGVEVDFNIWSITIEGSLRASGTHDERILFNISDTTLSGYHKARIYFTHESKPWEDSTTDGCLLEYVDIRCANYTAEYGIIRGGTLKLDHVSIYGSLYTLNEYHAVRTDGIITNCLFDSVILAVYMEEGIIENNQFSNIKKGAAINIVNGTVKDNVIDNTQIGINVKNALILNNTILNTKIYGVLIKNIVDTYEGDILKPKIIENIIRGCKKDALYISGYIKPLIRRNLIIDNENGIYFDENSFQNGLIPRIEYNVFYNNNNNINVENEDPRIEINLLNNWWGTNNITLIEDKIYHECDDPHLNNILYKPFLNALPSGLPEIKYEYEASVKPNEIELNNQITVSGKVKPSLEKVEIQLTLMAPDQSNRIESLITEEDGSFSYKFTPDSIGVWKVYIIPAENQLFIDTEFRELEFKVIKRSSRIDDCAASPKVVLKEDEVTIIGVLKPRLPNECIHVHVTDPDGARYQEQIITDNEGKFRHVLLAKVSGNYSINFTWQGTAEVEDASETIILQVHEPAQLVIVIKDIFGSPVQGVDIRSVFQPKGQCSLASTTNSNGTVIFSEILSGDYNFTVMKENYEPSTISSLSSEGGSSELEVNLLHVSAGSTSSQINKSQSNPDEASLIYGSIPSILTLVITIALYIVLHRGKSKS
ncbi:hypothetical protein JXL21_01780 [Candidatus Bathyarchaeota archaeon]|nr:hypothetical protein [Candidatus Bathyarchaeota archaeon]